MAIPVPQVGTVTTLWQQRSVAAVNEYRAGVQGAGQNWQQGVDGAEDNWVAGVNAAAANDSYQRGVSNKAAKYVDKAVNLGAGRYGPGVQAATNAYQSGMGKVLSEISAITLPPRMPAGSNAARSAAVADALHQAKIAGRLS